MSAAPPATKGTVIVTFWVGQATSVEVAEVVSWFPAANRPPTIRTIIRRRAIFLINILLSSMSMPWIILVLLKHIIGFIIAQLKF